MSLATIESGLAARQLPLRKPFGEAEVEMVSKAIRSQNLFGLGGEMVTAFESRFAERFGASAAVASTSGTAAIHVALTAVNPDPGDEIITAPITDAGTIVPILYQNAVPVFADLDDRLAMDPASIESLITPRTKAIIVVHLFGNPCDMEAICDIARRHDLWVVEDCCQAHLTELNGQVVGTFGDFGCFSFQQSKHMTTGDGGMTISSRADAIERMQLARDKGWTRKAGWGPRTYEFLAPNYRMTELQAAVGLVQLDKLTTITEKRHRLGTRLVEQLQDLPGFDANLTTPGSKHTYWLFPFRQTVGDPVQTADKLKALGLPAGAGYIAEPIYCCMEALANKKTFGNSNHPFDYGQDAQNIDYKLGLCPNAERLLNELLTIWIHEHMETEDIDYIAQAIRHAAGAES